VGKFTGGGQFIDMSGHKWSFGFNFRGTPGGSASGHFNAIDHNSGLHINGPVISIVNVCSNQNTCGTQSTTFVMRDTKTNCTYDVTVEDNGEPGANRDKIQIVSDPFGSCSFPGTGCNTLSAGNIQRHPTN